MAVKPVSFFTFSTNAVYTAGPAIGLANKVAPVDLLNGQLPGADFKAEYYNFLQNITGQYTEWVYGGSSSPTLDTPHIVETDALGVAGAAKMKIGPSAAAGAALEVMAPGPGGQAILATGVNAEGIIVTATGNFNPIFASTFSAATQAGWFEAYAGNSGGIVARGFGSGIGVDARGGANGIAVAGLGGATSGIGVRGTSQSSSPGVQGMSGNNVNSFGVQGIATNTSASGVQGSTAAGALAAASGVHGIAQNNGIAVRAQGSNSHALVMTNNNNFPLALFTPVSGRPTGVVEGGVSYDTDGRALQMGRQGQYEDVHSSRLGIVALRSITGANANGSSAGAAQAEMVVLQLTPYRVGNIIIDCWVHAFSNIDGAQMTLDIFDLTLGLIIKAKTMQTPAGAPRANGFNIRANYLLPNTNTRNLQFRMTVGTGTITWSDAMIEVRGIYQ